ncbi:trans-aconitate 2-methyltransferase [Phycisphaerales bacterium AB-hyl4]|uniref:Trans-aconitate 2-methyltransferase n=1 Tax=Natronomicrosphaera hydrolytica TaxID=3242702 RepID=A0ABV4U4A4_9BACT
MADVPRLYDDLAWLWPLLSPPEDYASEAATMRSLLNETLTLGAPGHRPTVLELGAGGGHALHHLRHDFDCVAVDLSAPMLANCRSLNPEVETHLGDMRSVRLNRKFDAVLIHDAIDYMTNLADLRATLSTAAAHLEPGGVALVAPTYIRETFADHETEQEHHANADVALTYFSYVHTLQPTDTTFELILLYLIKQPAVGGPVTVVEDRHVCGLFDEQTWLDLMNEAGFNCQRRTESLWELFVGVKR